GAPGSAMARTARLGAATLGAAPLGAAPLGAAPLATAPLGPATLGACTGAVPHPSTTMITNRIVETGAVMGISSASEISTTQSAMRSRTRLEWRQGDALKDAASHLAATPVRIAIGTVMLVVLFACERAWPLCSRR